MCSCLFVSPMGSNGNRYLEKEGDRVDTLEKSAGLAVYLSKNIPSRTERTSV